jgi:hypothetical protein
MTHLPLSCPQCEKPLVYVPLDGLTLHYRCVDHGLVILRPLVEVEPEGEIRPLGLERHARVSSCDAA